jgi:hypothetical protein
MPLDGILQDVLEELGIFIVAEDRRAIITPQNDVQQNILNEITWETSHLPSLTGMSSLTPGLPLIFGSPAPLIAAVSAPDSAVFATA